MQKLVFVIAIGEILLALWIAWALISSIGEPELPLWFIALLLNLQRWENSWRNHK